jgi:hypothetical protein
MAARTQTIDFLISRMEKLTDTEGDTHLSSAEKFEIMNSAIAETWDLICNSGLGEKYVTHADFSTVAGTLAYSLFTIAGTFYRVHQVYVLEQGGTVMRPLRKLGPAEIQTFTAPTAAVTMRLYYLPYSPVLTTGQSFDGINGWEEHTIMTACCAVKMKKEDDYRLFAVRKAELERRIKSMGNVDLGEPMRVIRKRSRRQDPFTMFNSNINAYGIRGDKIELYSYSGYVP